MRGWVTFVLLVGMIAVVVCIIILMAALGQQISDWLAGSLEFPPVIDMVEMM